MDCSFQEVRSNSVINCESQSSHEVSAAFFGFDHITVYAGDYDFELRLEKSFITAAAGCAQIPCAFTIPVRVYPVQKIWFRGSPEFPLSPPMVEEQANLMWPLRSPEHECSIILWDFSGHERIEEYGLMLKWGTNETHIYDERITVSYSTGMYV